MGSTAAATSGNNPTSSTTNKAGTIARNHSAAATAAGIPAPDPRAEALRCPRCDSSNTKFCYYNNYSLAQPRHFCKACKRYWTRGGTLRNVPVGGGCRKNKRSRKPSSSSSAASAISVNNNITATSLPNYSSSCSILPTLNMPNSSSLSSGLFFASSDGNNMQFPGIPSGAEAVPFDLLPQMDMLGLGYGQLAQQLKSSQQATAGGGGGLDEYPSFFTSSLAPVPGLEDLHATASARDVKLEGSDCKIDWTQMPNCEMAMDSMAAAAGMNGGTGNTSSLTYWNGGFSSGGGGWPEMSANCGSSVATLF